MKKIKEKAINDIKSLFKKHILIIFDDDVIPRIKEMIIEDYDLLLNGEVINLKSRTRPENYMDAFINRLDEFEYVYIYDRKLSLLVPDTDTFDFSGRLVVIQEILEGTAGSYIEVDMSQLEKMYDKIPPTLEFVDPFVPLKERIVKLRKTDDILNKLRTNNIPIVDYPFSNTPPINIFERTSGYIEKKLLGDSISEALLRANREFTKIFKV